MCCIRWAQNTVELWLESKISTPFVPKGVGPTFCKLKLAVPKVLFPNHGTQPDFSLKKNMWNYVNIHQSGPLWF